MRTLAQELKDIFGKRVQKLPLDGGFTCPNRESGSGCLFCSERGSGEFTLKGHITEQLSLQKQRLAHKWPGSLYLAYFQNFSGTYGPIGKLRSVYEEAIADDEVVGLAIATRVDCLDEDVLDLLEDIKNRTFLWLELGLQSVNPRLTKQMNLGYTVEDYVEAMTKLRERKIPVVSHMILGLPGSTFQDEMETAAMILKEKSWGVKIHGLYVQKGAPLAKIYESGEYVPLERDEYIHRVTDILELFGDEVVIHRLTGDPPHDELLAPLWMKDKRRVLGSIQKELARRKRISSLNKHLTR